MVEALLDPANPLLEPLVFVVASEHQPDASSSLLDAENTLGRVWLLVEAVSSYR